MDVKELRKKRKKLEDDIAKACSIFVEGFKVETGFSPNRINIDMVSDTKMGDAEPQFVVARCDVDIEI